MLDGRVFFVADVLRLTNTSIAMDANAIAVQHAYCGACMSHIVGWLLIASSVADASMSK